MHLVLALCLIVTLTPQHVMRVIDGDTVVLLDSDNVPPEQRIRILGVDAPERGQPNFQAATDSTTAWLARGNFSLAACRRDSFGRLLAWVSRGNDSLHVVLINAGLGVRPWP